MNYERDPFRNGRRRARTFKRRRAGGWGMGLYRNTREGKIGGVCAGLADHFDIAHWVMRLMWVGGFLFTGTLALWAYVAAWIVLSPQPSSYGAAADDGVADDYHDENAAMEYDERYHDYRPRRAFRYPEPGTVRLKRARERLDQALRRVEDMESYVTSRRFDLDREFSRL